MNSDLQALSQIPAFVWIILGVVLFAQGTWVFIDATKRGGHRWLWGIFCLFSTPGNLLVYLLVTRIIVPTKKCGGCGRYINKKAVFCSWCGKKQQEE